MRNLYSRGLVTIWASFLNQTMPHCWNQLQSVANQGTLCDLTFIAMFQSFYFLESILVSNVIAYESLYYRQTLHGAPGGISGNLQQVQSRNQQLQVSSACVSFYCLLCIYGECYSFIFLILVSAYLVCWNRT